MQMPHSKKASSASVIIVVLMVLSLMAISVDQLIRSTRIGSIFTNTMVDREHAKMLALGGVNIAIAQLSVVGGDENKPQDKNIPEEENEFGKGVDGVLKKFINHLLTNLNRWQIFELQEKIDGMTGVVKICISSEHGKINLNEAYDFKKQEFKKGYDLLLKTVAISNKLPEGELYKQLLEFLKKRRKKLSDISELLNISRLKEIDLFYQPPQLAQKKEVAALNRSIALSDLFTVWTDDATVDPLVFSDALCALVQVNRPRADDAKRLKDVFKQIALAFKKDLGSNWDANWKLLQPLYGEKPKILTEAKDILAKKFSSQVYSVVSYGVVNKVEQRVLAIIKEVEDKPKPKQRAQRSFKIMRLYWL